MPGQHVDRILVKQKPRCNQCFGKPEVGSVLTMFKACLSSVTPQFKEMVSGQRQLEEARVGCPWPRGL